MTSSPDNHPGHPAPTAAYPNRHQTRDGAVGTNRRESGSNPLHRPCGVPWPSLAERRSGGSVGARPQAIKRSPARAAAVVAAGTQRCELARTRLRPQPGSSDVDSLSRSTSCRAGRSTARRPVAAATASTTAAGNPSSHAGSNDSASGLIRRAGTSSSTPSNRSRASPSKWHAFTNGRRRTVTVPSTATANRAERFNYMIDRQVGTPHFACHLLA